MNNNIAIPIENNLGNAPLQLGDFFSNIVGVALVVAATITFGLIVWGGIQWIFAGGDKGKLEEAKNRITNAIIGLAIVAASWAIFLLLDHFLGLNVANNSSPSSSSSTKKTNSTSYGYGNRYCPYFGWQDLGFKQQMCVKTGVSFYTSKNSDGTCNARICEASDRTLRPDECPHGDCCLVPHIDPNKHLGLCP